MPTSLNLSDWSGPEIAAECAAAYSAYRATKTESYRAYFTAHPDLRDPTHAYRARDLAAALPEEWAGLCDSLPVEERHRHHLSGNSSQVLALGILGAGARMDPSLRWLWDAMSSTRYPPPPPRTPNPAYHFELRLAPETLNERPRQTSVDFAVSDPATFMCIEAKWTEAGLGACSCPGGAALTSGCSERVLERSRYWDAVREVFHLPVRVAGQPCPLSYTYQAVRNVAAAIALAEEGQQPVFGLIYDTDNPYFSGTGNWPGWPTVLDAALNELGSPVLFASVSWQELIELAPLDPPAAAWASEKHGIHKPLN